MNTSEIFIENGRFHGRQIAYALAEKLGASTEELPAIPAPATHLRNAE